MRLDLLTSEPQYRAHLSPIFAALPEDLRGADIRARGPRANAGKRGDAVLVGSRQDLAQAERMGYGRIAYAEHGIGQSYGNRHPGYPGGLKRGAISLFLSPNATAAAADAAAYPEARVVVVGDPRLDTLPKPHPLGQMVAFSFHWNCEVAPETRSAFRFYRDAIAALARDVPLLGHAHPRIAHDVQRFCAWHGIPFTRDFEDVVVAARLYICDNSSSMYEFAAGGRPVVVLNAPWYRRDVEFGLRFWAAAGVGLQVDAPSALSETVHRAMEDAPAVAEERERALDLAYGFRSGAAERAAAAIAEWL